MASPIIVIVLGMVVLLLDLGASDARRRAMLPLLSLLGLFIAAVASYPLTLLETLPATVGPATYFGGGMVGDQFGGLFCIVLCVIAALAIAMSGRFLEEKHLNHGEYYALILFATAGSMLMALSFDLVNIFIGLEILSVALYILSGFMRRDLRSEEAAVKYFLLGAFASGFLLFGIALIYGAVGLSSNVNSIVFESRESFTNLFAIGQVLRQSAGGAMPLMTSPVFVAGVALLIVGLGFKAAIVPFHSYAPDVYEGAPTPVTAFMSAGAKAGAFAAFVRVCMFILPVEGSEPFRAVLWGLAAATMIVGNVLAVRQSNIKRMLAYSSIAHAGYILVGVLASSNPASGALARGAILYYMFAYTFMNLGAFALVVWLSRAGREYTQISDYAGLSRRQPLAAAVMAVFMLSLAGIPPAAGFFGKLYLFLAAVQTGLVGLAALGLVVSVIGVYYYLNIIVAMYFRQPEHDFASARKGGAMVAACVAAIGTLVLGVMPLRPFLPRMEVPMTSPMRPGGAMPAQPTPTIPRREPQQQEPQSPMPMGTPPSASGTQRQPSPLTTEGAQPAPTVEPPAASMEAAPPTAAPPLPGPNTQGGTPPPQQTAPPAGGVTPQ